MGRVKPGHDDLVENDVHCWFISDVHCVFIMSVLTSMLGMGLAGGRSVSIKGTRAGVITPRGVLPLSEMNSGLDQRFNHPPFLHPAAPNAHIIIWAVTAPSSPLTMPIVSNLCGHKTDFFPLPRGVGTVKEYCGLPKGFAFLGDWRPRFHTQKPVATCYDRSSSCPSPFLFPSPLKTLICFNS